MDNNKWPFYEQYREASKNSYIRLLHASPDAPLVDVYANDKLIAKNLSYKEFSPYIQMQSGNYNITIFPAGTKVKPVLKSTFFVPPRSIFTIAASGRLSNLNLLAIPEPIKQIPPGKAFIRFAHLSPDAPEVDVVLKNETKLFSNVSFKEFTEYVPIKPGNLTLDIRPSRSNKSILYVPNIVLKPNRFYTVYVVGSVSGKPPLQALIPLDGNSYLKF